MNFLRNLWAFIKSKTFLKHLGIAIVSVCLTIWLIFRWLSYYTDHNNSIEVPDFSGLKLSEIDAFASAHDLRDTIIDSVYDDKKPHGVVVSQDPENKSFVKHNRMVYLSVNSMLPQMVGMPNLVDASPRQATQILETYGLKVSTKLKAGLSCVLEQLFNGKKIEPGTKIPKGSKITLVIGSGQLGEEVTIPCLSGMTREEAGKGLANAGFSEGAVVCPDCKTTSDTANAKVYKQVPNCCKECTTSSGSSIDIYLTLKADSVKTP